MSKTSKPRRGSLQFAPRKRARRIYPKLKVKPVHKEKVFNGFAGYKVGMLSVKMIENKKGSVNYGKEVVVPATILEVPDLFIFGVRAYEPLAYGYRCVGEVWSYKPVERYLSRKIKLPKKYSKTIDDLKLDESYHIRALVCTQPWKAGINKKTPEIFEVPLYGNFDDILSFIKENLGKEYSIDNVFTAGDFIDVSAVTKGKGFQGSVKRFGVKIQKRGKTDKVARRVGTLGPWHPAKTSWRVPQHGQMGFHTRTEYNKMILEIGSDTERVNKPSGWMHYGVIRSKYVILKGSVPGAIKRLVMMRPAVRHVKGDYDRVEIEKLLL